MLERTACLQPELGELAEAYALGTLDDAERARFERHLASCQQCRAEVEMYAGVTAGLPHALAAASPTVRPPATLRERVLNAAAGEQAPGAKAARLPLRSPLKGAAPPAAAAGGGGKPAGGFTPRRWWRSVMKGPSSERAPTVPWFSPAAWRGPRLAALAAAAIVTLAVGWGVEQGVALARERAQLRAEYAMLVSQQETVLEVVDARNTVKRNLAPPDGGAGAGAPYGKLYTRPDLSDVVAMAGRLPPPPAGQAYHLWLTQPGQSGPQLGGVLAFNQGFGLLVFDTAKPGPTYEAAWVTLQPPGSAAPTGPTVLRWQGN